MYSFGKCIKGKMCVCEDNLKCDLLWVASANTRNDWAVWAFFMTNVSSFFCLSALELLKLCVAFYMCTLALATVGISLCLWIFILKCTHNIQKPIISNELWPKESVVFAHHKFIFPSPSLLQQQAATAPKSPLDSATIANQTGMCKSSWFCVSQLIEHIKIHCIATILIRCHTKNATLFIRCCGNAIRIEFQPRWIRTGKQVFKINCHFHFALGIYLTNNITFLIWKDLILQWIRFFSLGFASLEWFILSFCFYLVFI